MAGRLQDKVAVITGGASGMGQATALRFLDEGALVVIGDLNAINGEATLKLAAEAGHGDRIRFLQGDVSEEEDVAALVNTAVADFGRLDCMFNNAGVGGAFGPITETTVDEWDYTFAVLVRGVFLGCKYAVRQMQRQGGGGTVLSTASIAGLSGGAGAVAYSAAKAAVVNLTRALAGELAHDRIRINAIAPGGIRTPLLHSGKAELMEGLAKDKTPWERLGEGSDIAATALFLASDESEFITGQTLVVDGGALAAAPDFFGHSPTGILKSRAGVNRGTTGEKADWREIPRGDV